MTDATRCDACGEPVEGVGPRYCARCGAPIGVDVRAEAGSVSSEISVGDRRGPRLLATAAAAVVVVVAVLVVVRRGEEDAAPPPTTVPAPPTTVVTTTSTSTTTTTIPEGPLGRIDVGAVPEPLAGLSLLAEAANRSEVPDLLAIDLGTGDLTAIEPRVGLGEGDGGPWSTPLGVVALQTTGSAVLVDWDFGRRAFLEEGQLRELVPVDGRGAGWYVAFAGTVAEVRRIDPDTFDVEPVRQFSAWGRIVGTADDGVLVREELGSGVWQLTGDGRSERLDDRAGLWGGRNWVAVDDCGPDLRCELVVVDLATGREAPVPGLRPLWSDVVALSDDGRRALVRLGLEEGPRYVLVDADDMATTELTDLELPPEWPLVVDDELRYVFASIPAGVTARSLTSGEELLFDIDRPEWRHYWQRSLLRPPSGWTPPD